MNLKLIWHLFVHEMKLRKQGLLIGAGVGLLAAAYFINKGADINTIVEGGKGIMDSVFNRQSAVQVAKYKMYLAFAFFGALVGYLGEWLFDSLKIISATKNVSRRKRSKRR